MMRLFRTTPPKSLLGSRITEIRDYKLGTCKYTIYNVDTIINLPKSDVLQFITESGTKVSIRPSGTEPKIKFYFSIKGELHNIEDFNVVNQDIENDLDKLSRIFTDME